MDKLTHWLPEKEMFGVFRLRTVNMQADALEVIVHNETFCFTISFQRGVSRCRVALPAEYEQRLRELRQDYEVIMRGNSFFKLCDGPEGKACHYLILATNCVLDIWAECPAKVRLEKSAYGPA